MRVFFDTNVIVSAFLARGLCADLLRRVLSEHTLVSSEVVIEELREVLARKGRLPSARIEEIEAMLRDQPVAPWPQEPLSLELDDLDDAWVLASAVLAEADLFVTGDQAVLACPTLPFPILNPRACWQALAQG